MQVNDPKVIKSFHIIAFVLFVTGFALVCVFAHWAAALGVVLLIWANNLQQAANILTKVEELVDTMRDAMDARYQQK